MYVTISDIRRAGGFPSSLASDTDIQNAINLVEPLVERAMNTKFSPTLRVDILQGTGNSYIYTDRLPINRVTELISGDTEIDIEKTNIDYMSGKIMLSRASDKGIFHTGDKGVRIKYWFSYLEDSDVFTELEEDIETTDTTFEVSDATDFSENDWVEISGTDGNKETTKITNIAGNNITVDLLTFGHNEKSIIRKKQAPSFIRRFIELETVIYLGINAVGATYVFNAGYSLGDLNVQKGVPYTHWTASLQKCLSERESLRNIIKPRIRII